MLRGVQRWLQQIASRCVQRPGQMVHPSGIERSRSTGVAPAAVQTAKKKPPLRFSVEKAREAQLVTKNGRFTSAPDFVVWGYFLPIHPIKQRQSADHFPKTCPVGQYNILRRSPNTESPPVPVPGMPATGLRPGAAPQRLCGSPGVSGSGWVCSECHGPRC